MHVQKVLIELYFQLQQLQLKELMLIEMDNSMVLCVMYNRKVQEE